MHNTTSLYLYWVSLPFSLSLFYGFEFYAGYLHLHHTIVLDMYFVVYLDVQFFQCHVSCGYRILIPVELLLTLYCWLMVGHNIPNVVLVTAFGILNMSMTQLL